MRVTHGNSATQWKQIGDSQSEIQNSPAADKLIPVWEALSVASSFLIAEWLVESLVGNYKFFGTIPIGLAFGFIFVSHRIRGETLRDIGFRGDNFLSAIGWLAPPTVVAVAAILALGWAFNSLDFEELVSRPVYLRLLLWSLAQQYVAQGFINRRAQLVWGKGWRSVLFVAVLFTLFRLPNIRLCLLAFLGGILWAAVYQRHPNLPALAISQAILLLVLALALPHEWLNGLRIGLRYLV